MRAWAAWLLGLLPQAPLGLAVNRLVGVGWRVDYTLSSSLLRTVEEPLIHLQLEVAASATFFSS